MASVSFSTYDYYNGGWVGSRNWGSGYFYAGAENRSDNINNLVAISVSGASSSSPITSITVSVSVCLTGSNDTGTSTSITGYLYDTYTTSLKGSTAAVPYGYVSYGTSSTITATSSGRLATFTISGLNITSNGYIYLKLYSSSSYLKQIYTGAGSISCTTGSSGGDDSGGDDTVIYSYRAYDITTSTYITSSTSTTSSSILRPSLSAYTYLGFVTHTSYSQCISYYNSRGVEDSANYCTIHNSSYRYILFFYASDSSSGGEEEVYEYSVTSKGVWSTGVSSKTVSIASYQILRYSFTPTSDGTLTFSSGTTGTDTIGWINSSTSCVVDDKGYPSYYIGSYNDDANGSAFSATAELSANTTYYLFVCCYNGKSSSSNALSINFEAKQQEYVLSSAGTWSTTVSSKSLSIGSYTVYRYKYTPTISGTLTFSSSTTGVDTIGWISSGIAMSVNTNGYPSSSSYIGSYNDDANGSAFSATAAVVANEVYYLFVCCYGGRSGSVTLSVSITSPRPNNWSWTNTISSGSQIKLTAAEWNSFTSRINEFRDYKGLSAYSFTTAISGTTPIEYTICNQAYTAINAITGHGTMPAQLTNGGPLYASFFNGLKDALNAIP